MKKNKKASRIATLLALSLGIGTLGYTPSVWGKSLSRLGTTQGGAGVQETVLEWVQDRIEAPMTTAQQIVVRPVMTLAPDVVDMDFSKSLTEDQSAAQNHGKLQGQPQQIDSEHFKREVLALDGSSYIRIPHNQSLLNDHISVVTSFTLDRLGVTQDIVAKTESSNYGIEIEPDGKMGIWVYINTPGGTQDGYAIAYAPKPLETDTVYHVAFTYDGKDLVLYVNGEEVARDTSKPGTIGARGKNPQLRNVDLLVGADPQIPEFAAGIEAQSYTYGQISQMKVYSEAITQEQVEELYQIEEAQINPLDKSKLEQAIEEAVALSQDAVVGEGQGEYPLSAKQALDTAREEAQAVLGEEKLTQSQVDLAVAALQQAIVLFKESQIKGEKLLSFQVISDVHVDGLNHNTVPNKQFINALKDMKEIDPESKGIVIVGDTTEAGFGSHYDGVNQIVDKYAGTDVYYALGNHDIRWLPGGYEEGKNRFISKTGMPGIYYDEWIDGYHFIVLGTDKDLSDDAYFSEEQFAWLEEKLAEEADQNKPIFIFNHQPIRDTVSLSETADGIVQYKRLRNLLGKYPQAVYFSGHTHFDMRDPRNIYDEKYCTMINTGAVHYLWDDKGHVNGSQGLFVEVYDGQVVVKGRDFIGKKWLSETQYDIGYPPSFPSFDQVSPIWPQQMQLEVLEIGYDKVKLAWPEATDEVGVKGYNLYKLEQGEKVLVTSVGADVQEKVIGNLKGNTTYTLMVEAFDGEDNTSKTLSVKVTTEDFVLEPELLIPDILEMHFDQSLTQDVSKAQNHGQLQGEPQQVFDPEFNQKVVALDGKSCIRIPHQDSMNTDYLTIEAAFSVEDTSGYQNIVAKTESSNYGLEIDNGILKTWIYVEEQGGYAIATYPEKIQTHTIYHVATTYDGQEAVLYINGEKVGADASKPGTIGGIARGMDLLIGADPQPNPDKNAQSFLKGKVSHVRIYSQPLSQEYIEKLYENYEEILTAVNRKPLEALIQEAESLWQEAVVGNKLGEYTQEAVDTFKAAIEKAKEDVVSEITQEALDAVVGTLKEAIETFKEAKNTKELAVKTTFNSEKLRPNQLLEAKVTLTNHSSRERQVVLMMTLYDEKQRMVDMSYTTVSIKMDGTRQTEIGLKLPSRVAGHRVKVMIWEGDGLEMASEPIVPVAEILAN